MGGEVSAALSAAAASTLLLLCSALLCTALHCSSSLASTRLHRTRGDTTHSLTQCWASLLGNMHSMHTCRAQTDRKDSGVSPPLPLSPQPAITTVMWTDRQTDRQVGSATDLVGALPELVARGALVRSRGALAMLDDPGMSLYVFEGDAFLRVEDEELFVKRISQWAREEVSRGSE